MNAFTERLVDIEVEETVRIPPAVVGGEMHVITVKVPAKKDTVTGEVYLGHDAVSIMDKAKARQMGVLAPQELAELRERLGLTQSEISHLLQIGEKSWSRWETGREIPSRSINLLLLGLFEGKISVPWLRARHEASGHSLEMPVLRAHGWEGMVHEQLSPSNVLDAHTVQQSVLLGLSPYLDIPLKQDQWPALEGPRSWLKSQKLCILRVSLPTVHYERMPLCA